jgi:hypothetical protein
VEARRKNINNMGKPFKMKYTNGKKADSSSFPFKVEAAKPGDSPAQQWDWESAGGGAAKGAAAGAVLGPWGAVAGGAIGGVVGGIQGGQAKEAAKAAAEKAAIEQAYAEKKHAREVQGVNKGTVYTAPGEPTEEDKKAIPNQPVAS